MMRTTLYDSFGAGWRVDRLFQMIGRDPLGFLKAWFVSFIGGAVCVAYTVLMAMVGSVIALGGIAAVVSTGYAYHYGTRSTLCSSSWHGAPARLCYSCFW